MACSPPFRNLGLLDEADRMETDEKAIQKHIQLFAISSIILFVAITAVILVGNIQKPRPEIAGF